MEDLEAMEGAVDRAGPLIFPLSVFGAVAAATAVSEEEAAAVA